MNSSIFIVLFIFALFVFFNLYIRIKTFKLYRQLVEKRIDFTMSDLVSSQRWNKIMANYPGEEELLLKFRKHMLSTAILFIAVIAIVVVLLFIIRSMNQQNGI